jgi:hypothetical protein
MTTLDIILSSPAATALLILLAGGGVTLALAIAIGAWVSQLKQSIRRRPRLHTGVWRAALN